MELVSLDLQLAEFLGRRLLAGWIVSAVETGAHDEAAAVRRVADEIDDRLVESAAFGRDTVAEVKRYGPPGAGCGAKIPIPVFGGGSFLETTDGSLFPSAHRSRWVLNRPAFAALLDAYEDHAAQHYERLRQQLIIYFSATSRPGVARSPR